MADTALTERSVGTRLTRVQKGQLAIDPGLSERFGDPVQVGTASADRLLVQISLTLENPENAMQMRSSESLL